LSGRDDFLYVADSKLCSFDNMLHIDGNGGRLVTVMPRSRKEDEWFRKRVQTELIPWVQVWDRPAPRRKHGPRDRWYVYSADLPSREGWPIVWVYSTLLALKQKQGRLERLERHTRSKDGQLVQAFPATLSDLQAKVIGLLAVPKTAAYG